MALMRAHRGGAQVVVVLQELFVAANAAGRLEPIDLLHEVGAGQVEGSGERATGVVDGCLVRRGGQPERAACGHACHGPRLAADLPGDDRAVGSGGGELGGVRAASVAATLVAGGMRVRHGAHHTHTVNSFTEPETAVEYARSRWEEGEQRVQRAAPDSRRRDVLEEVVAALLQELEKRVGQTFTTLDLATIQDEAEPWCTRVAHEVAPDDPWAWELDTVQNAAFHRYARRASDYQMPSASDR